LLNFPQNGGNFWQRFLFFFAYLSSASGGRDEHAGEAHPGHGRRMAISGEAGERERERMRERGQSLP